MKTTSNGFREGFCAQHYHVQRFKVSGGSWLDLLKLDAQFFPDGRDRALVLVTRHDKVLDGIAKLRAIAGRSPVHVEAIEYCISACDGRRVVTQDFIHDFKRPALLYQEPAGTRKRTGGAFSEPWWLYHPAGPLFTTRPLNDILQSRSFGRIAGAQFCC